MKAYQALGLSNEQRTMITTALEAMSKTGCVDELRRISIRIMDVSGPKHDEELFDVAAKEEDQESFDGTEEDELTMALQKPRMAKAKSRAGALERSIQSTKTLYGGNTKANAGENQCLRCKQFGHWWRDCPKPFEKTLVFPKMKVIGKGSTGKTGKGSYDGKAGEKGKGKTFLIDEAEKHDDPPNETPVVGEGSREEEERYEPQLEEDY